MHENCNRIVEEYNEEAIKEKNEMKKDISKHEIID